VRLIAIPEGALRGFNDEVLDLDHAQFAREGAIDIPGEETEILGQLARECDTFIIAQAKARHPDWKDRFFNVGFILDPRGEVILQHYKVSPLFPVEHSICPLETLTESHPQVCETHGQNGWGSQNLRLVPRRGWWTSDRKVVPWHAQFSGAEHKCGACNLCSV